MFKTVDRVNQHTYIYISNTILDFKAIKVFSDMYPQLQDLIILGVECKNYFFHGNIVLLKQFTHLQIVQKIVNWIHLNRYKLFSEQIIQFNKQHDVIDISLKFIWYILTIRIFSLHVLFSFWFLNVMFLNVKCYLFFKCYLNTLSYISTNSKLSLIPLKWNGIYCLDAGSEQHFPYRTCSLIVL